MVEKPNLLCFAGITCNKLLVLLQLNSKGALAVRSVNTHVVPHALALVCALLG